MPAALATSPFLLRFWKEVPPEVQSLSRLDNNRLIQFLERDEGGLIEPGRSYTVWSPTARSARRRPFWKR